jgi:hypothetical protein
MYIFYTATSITIGNGRKTPFWQAPWLDWRKPIEIVLLIFAISKRKNWKVCNAMKEDAWVAKVELGDVYSLEHISQFVRLWCLLLEVQLDDATDAKITWKLMENG